MVEGEEKKRPVVRDMSRAYLKMKGIRICELISWSWLIAKIANESRMFVTLYDLSAVTKFRFFRKDVIRLCMCYIKAAKQQQLNK
eukprot:scaffold244_cov126-Skeletonema_dohrnii-CCMP3373.AAC.1